MNTVSLVKTRTLVVAKVVGLLAFAAAAFFIFPLLSLANPAMCGLQQVNDATFVNFLVLDPHSPAGQYHYIKAQTNPTTPVGQLVLVKAQGKTVPAVISSVMGTTAKGFTNSAGTGANGVSVKFALPTGLTSSSTKRGTKGISSTAVFSSFLNMVPSMPYDYTASGTSNYGGATLVGQWIIATVDGKKLPIVLSGKVMNGTARGLNPEGIDTSNMLKITGIPAAAPMHSTAGSVPTNW